MISKMTGWLATMPSTNTRIAVTLWLACGTGVRYWSSASWQPSWEWLAFLTAMAGVDVAQFAVKRRTDVIATQQATRNSTAVAKEPE
jgi:hypothetical protein